MSRCLHCHEPFFEKASWRKLLMLDPPAQLCSDCESKLVEIRGKRCLGCSRSLDSLPIQYMKGDECRDCWNWKQQAYTRDLLERNVSLYQYNSFLKEWLATYKYRGDAIIASFFAEKFAILYKNEFNGYIPIEIPLSKERLLQRGFNQSVLLMQGWAEEAGLLMRHSGEKQSKKNRKQRIMQVETQPFQMKLEKKSLIAGKNIVLIDDIYTTGTTVRQAARILKEHGANRVASITVAR